MEIPRHFHAILLCAVAIFLNSIHCDSKQHEERKLLFVFGDSLFDPGNNQYLSSSGKKSSGTSWPYGMNNHNHSTGRLSDGLLVPDFIAKFAGLNILPPYMQPNANFSDGVNFASAGAGVLETTTIPNIKVMSLRTQLDDFKKVISLMGDKANTKNILMRSVFLISMGGNDYFSFNTKYSNATETQRRDYINTVLGNLTSGFKELYGMGLRNLAVQNVGPLGCYPMVKSMYPELKGSCVTRFSEIANEHNQALSIALKELERGLVGFKYSIFDYYNALGDRLKNPTKYGFKVGDTACCGSGLYNSKNCGGGDNGTLLYNLCKNPNDYVLFDGGHHTQRTNYQLAQLLWSGAPNITSPYNMKQLF